MAEFCTLIDKNASPNHPNVKGMPSPHVVRTFHCLNISAWKSVDPCKNMQKVSINLPR